MLQPVATNNEDLILSFTYEKKWVRRGKDQGCPGVTPDREKLAGLQCLPDRIIQESEDITALIITCNESCSGTSPIRISCMSHAP